MSEKYKSKVHPFTAYIRPDETILWMGQQDRPPLWRILPSLAVFLLLPLLIPGIFLLGLRPINSFASCYYGLAELGLLGASIMKVFAIVGAINSPVLNTYAVTNERLLYRDPKGVAALSLEKIQIINIVNRDGLSFGPLFPMWSHIAEVETVKQLIDTARKNRLKELQS